VEAKLLQTAATLRTFFALVISAEALKSLVAFLGKDGSVSLDRNRCLRRRNFREVGFNPVN
jgi:hypothetical protein